jgi:hypothetical protein
VVSDAWFNEAVARLVADAQELERQAFVILGPPGGRWDGAKVAVDALRPRFTAWDDEAVRWIERSQELDPGGVRVPAAHELVLAGRDLCHDLERAPSHDPVMVEEGLERLREALADLGA